MSKRLTEEMVIARTKISDLSKIKRLNCWGSELIDVSLLRKMPCVEVLSLSINKINSLVDFQFCKRLEELYIRQNDIRDINEVVYLQNLPNLKNLWLGENPCTNVEGYRLAVIKALPQLQKLDNVQVAPDELRDAQRNGRTLTHPDDVQESEDDDYVQHHHHHHQPQPVQQYNKYQEYSESEYSPVQRSPPREDQSPPRRGSSNAVEPSRKSYSPEPVYVERRRNSYERESPKQYQQQQQQYYERCQAGGEEDNNVNNCDITNYTRDMKIVTSQSASCIKEYTNGDRYAQQSHPQYRPSESSNDLSSAGRRDQQRFSSATCPAAHNRPPFARRPVTRNSNILSAVLRLVKELDYPSLEVLEMEVRSRMDELDE